MFNSKNLDDIYKKVEKIVIKLEYILHNSDNF